MDYSLTSIENAVETKKSQDTDYCHYLWSTLDLQCYDPITYSAFSSFSLMSPLITSAGMMSSVIYNGNPRTGSAKSSSLSVDYNTKLTLSSITPPITSADGIPNRMTETVTATFSSPYSTDTKVISPSVLFFIASSNIRPIFNSTPAIRADTSTSSVTTIFTPSSSVHYLIGSTNIKPTVMFISIPSTRTEILSSSLDHSPTSVAYYSSLSTSPASSTFSRPGSSLDLSDPKLLGAFAAVLVLLIIIIILIILLSICCYMKCKQPVKSSIIQGFDNPDNNGESLAKKIEILWSCVIKLT